MALLKFEAERQAAILAVIRNLEDEYFASLSPRQAYERGILYADTALGPDAQVGQKVRNHGRDSEKYAYESRKQLSRDRQFAEDVKALLARRPRLKVHGACILVAKRALPAVNYKTVERAYKAYLK